MSQTEPTDGPFVWLDVDMEEDVTICWETKVAVPSGLSDDEIDELLLEDRYQNQICQSSNMKILDLIEDYGLEWKPTGQLWDWEKHPREKHLLVHTKGNN